MGRSPARTEMNPFTKVAIGLGSNLSDRLAVLKRAAEAMEKDFLTSVESSRVYESPPWGKQDQPDFLNAVVVGLCEWKPPAIVNYLKTLERDLGRVPSERFGPRVIDLDLLIYSDVVWKTEGVEVPHPRLFERDFVLLPLRELWPEWRHPVLGKTVDLLFQELSKNQPPSAKAFAPRLLDKAIP